MQRGLEVVLPDEMTQIGSFYSDDLLGVSQYSPDPAVSDWNILKKTLELRRGPTALPQRYVVLAELSESVIFLETQESAEDAAPVIWIDSVEAALLGTGEAPTSNRASGSQPMVTSSSRWWNSKKASEHGAFFSR